MRGNAGTHDLQLGVATLSALRSLNSAGPEAAAPVAVPRYDKSAFGGLGDRAAQETWPTVSAPLDVVLFEGWMLGFAPVGAEAAAAVEPALVEVDRRLAAYKEAWDSACDAWLVVRIGDPQWVFGWRLQVRARAGSTLNPRRWRDADEGLAVCGWGQPVGHCDQATSSACPHAGACCGGCGATPCARAHDELAVGGVGGLWHAVTCCDAR